MEARFEIGLHSKDLPLLLAIQSFFGGIGIVQIYSNRKVVYYKVQSIKDLTNMVIPHFLKYSLLTKKRADFELFKMVVDLISNKDHLTKEGLRQIVNIKASMNLGLRDTLIESFPNISPVSRPEVKVQ